MAGIRVNMAGTRAKSALLWCVSVLAFSQGFFGWGPTWATWGHRGEPSSHSGASTKNITLVRGYLPPTTDSFTPLPDHQLPMDVLFIPGFEDETGCWCGLHLDKQERCLESVCAARDVRNDATKVANCEFYADQGKCRTNAQYMMKECAMACGAREKCRDLKEHCSFWADEGECAKNPGYMASYCPVACDMCAARADPKKACHDRFPDWQEGEDSVRDDPAAHYGNVLRKLREDFGDNATVLSETPLVVRIDNFMSQSAAERIEALIVDNEKIKYVRPTGADQFPTRTAGFAWCMKACDEDAAVQNATAAVAAMTSASSLGAVEHFHFLQVDLGQQYGVHHDFSDNLHLSATGPRLFTVNIFLEDLPPRSGGELWFPELDIAVAPVRGTAVLWGNVDGRDVLRPDTRTRHGTRRVDAYGEPASRRGTSRPGSTSGTSGRRTSTRASGSTASTKDARPARRPSGS